MAESAPVTSSGRAVPVAPDEEGNYERQKRPLLRQPWVQQFVPLLTSLTVHAGLIILAAIVLASGVLTVLVEEKVDVPVKTATATFRPNVGADNDPTRQATTLDPVDVSVDNRSRGEGETTADALASGSNSSATGNTGLSGMSDALGPAGGLSGGGLTAFGPPGGGGGLFEGIGDGDGGNNRRIVFVCDSSGSMQGEKQFLLFDELRSVITGLEPVQAFNIIFFSGTDANMAFNELRPATLPIERQASDFLETVAMTGQTNPIPALRQAFAMEPDLIFFLTDGAFNNIVSYDEVTGTIRSLYRESSSKPVINTIQFIDQEQAAAEVMESIATETGGRFRFVGRDFFD